MNDSNRKRLTILACLIFSLFSLLLGQFYKIQITDYKKWTEIAGKQHYFYVKEPFRRGIFLSDPVFKRGHPDTPQALVVDIEKFHLFVDPLSIPQKIHSREIAEQLLKILEISPVDHKNFIEEFFKSSRSRKLAMWLDLNTRDLINRWWVPYSKKNKIPSNAIYFTSDYQRSYPFGKLLGQVLHTIQNNKDEMTKQAIPTGGLELYFNSYLTGKEGKRKMMRSPRNSLETGEVITKPVHGADVFLTINHFLQAIAEEELEKGVKRCRAKGGWAVMMDPYTGEILALAQYPYFYPPDYPKYFNDPSLTEQTKIKSVTDSNEPGSVMKAMTMAIALKANDVLKSYGHKPIFDPEEKIAVSNGQFPGRTKPLTDGRLHHYLNMNMAIQKSSNIYPARLVEKIVSLLGDSWYRSQLVEIFGIGTKTGIEIPSESPGLLPTPGKVHPNGRLEWSKPTPYSLAIGHNLQVNSIQLVRAFAVFANGGYLVKPTIVRKIVRNNDDGTRQILFSAEKKERSRSFPKVLSDDIVSKVVNAMKYVTKPRGSSARGEIWGYTEVGKSGTAEKIINGVYSKKTHLSSFVGFTPATNPAFVLLVSMDEPEYKFIPGVGKNQQGGICASPVFRDIATRSLEYLGIPPDDPHGYPVGDPRYDKNKANWIKECDLLHVLYEKWNASK